MKQTFFAGHEDGDAVHVPNREGVCSACGVNLKGFHNLSTSNKDIELADAAMKFSADLARIQESKKKYAEKQEEIERIARMKGLTDTSVQDALDDLMSDIDDAHLKLDPKPETPMDAATLTTTLKEQEKKLAMRSFVAKLAVECKNHGWTLERRYFESVMQLLDLPSTTPADLAKKFPDLALQVDAHRRRKPPLASPLPPPQPVPMRDARTELRNRANALSQRELEEARGHARSELAAALFETEPQLQALLLTVDETDDQAMEKWWANDTNGWKSNAIKRASVMLEIVEMSRQRHAEAAEAGGRFVSVDGKPVAPDANGVVRYSGSKPPEWVPADFPSVTDEMERRAKGR